MNYGGSITCSEDGKGEDVQCDCWVNIRSWMPTQRMYKLKCNGLNVASGWKSVTLQ
jgi:hypothetical protein